MLDAGNNDSIFQRGIDEAVSCQDMLAHAGQAIAASSGDGVDCCSRSLGSRPPPGTQAASASSHHERHAHAVGPVSWR